MVVRRDEFPIIDRYAEQERKNVINRVFDIITDVSRPIPTGTYYCESAELIKRLEEEFDVEYGVKLNARK